MAMADGFSFIWAHTILKYHENYLYFYIMYIMYRYTLLFQHNMQVSYNYEHKNFLMR